MEGVMTYEDEEEDGALQPYLGNRAGGAGLYQFDFPDEADMVEQRTRSPAGDTPRSMSAERAFGITAEPRSGSANGPSPGSVTEQTSAGMDVDAEPALEYDSDQSSSQENELDHDDSAFTILQSDIFNYLQAAPSNAAQHASAHSTLNALPSSLPPVVARFRRPETTDPTDFYYCTPSTWNHWLAQVISGADKRQAATAADRLRVFHIAGLLMETDEGVDAENQCQLCARQTKYTPCRIYANKASTRCAYCINKHKSHCSSGPSITPRKRMRMVTDVAGATTGSTPSSQSSRGILIGNEDVFPSVPQQRRSASQSIPYRRPETVNPSDFWWVPEEKWALWVKQGSGAPSNATTNAARASLRLSSRAGIVMESDDSHTNDPPCVLCERTKTPCKVLASEIGRTCAYCSLRRVKCTYATPHSTDRRPNQASLEHTVQAPPIWSVIDNAAPAEVNSRFRRPQSTDPSDFWHCGVERWDSLHLHYASAAAEGKETAYRVLQLIDKAGRLMETSEGEDSEVPCLACAQAGEVCRFSAVGRKANERCAYCKLKYRKCHIRENGAASTSNKDVLVRSDVPHSGFKRKRVEETDGLSSQDFPVLEGVDEVDGGGTGAVVKQLVATVASLQQQIQVLHARDAAREVELQKESKRVKLMAQNFQRVGADLSKGWKRFLRDEFPDEADEDEDAR